MRPEASAREAILLLALAGFNAGISLRCVEPMLPRLAEDFGTGVPAASVVITTFAFAYAASLVLQGPLGDRFGKLRVVTVGMACAGAASLGCAAAWSLESLAALRFATGMFSSASVVLGLAYIGDVVPIGERQATIAHFISGSILGQAVGPLFGGMLTDWVGWRAPFLVLGLVFLAVAATLYFRTAATWQPPLPGKLMLLSLYRSLLARPAMRWLLLVGPLETIFFFGAFAFLGAYLRQRFDLSFTLIGLVLAGVGVGGLLYTATARPIIRALGERGMYGVSGLLGFIGFTALVVAPHWGFALPSTVLLGVAFFLLHNTVQTRATEVAPDARGAAVALYASGWALGQALGVAAMGSVVALAGYAWTILGCGVAFGLLGLWLRANPQRLRP